MTNLQEVLEVLEVERLMQEKADKGEKPECPVCRTGHIVSLCGGRVYKCDDPKCHYYMFVNKK